MLNSISPKNTKKFANISGDKNKIHLNNKIAEQYFFRKPIVHGINLLLIVLCKFLLKKNFKKIEYIKINFTNFCLNDEKFNIKFKKNSFLVKSKINKKINVDLKFSNVGKIDTQNQKLDIFIKKVVEFYNINVKNFFNLDYIEHVIYISKIIGNFDLKQNCLIHSVTSERNSFKENNFSFKYKKIVKSMNEATFVYNGYTSKVIFSRLIKLKYNLNKFKLDKKTQKKIKNKKILIFGASGDISKALLIYLKKTKSTIFKYSLNKKVNFLKLKKYIIRIKPHYIFYFSSPQIYNDALNNKMISKNYYDVYFKKFKKILDILNRVGLNTKVFYPSTFAIKNISKYKRIKSYLLAKKKGENLCKNHKYSKNIYCYRLPAFKSKTNYNMLGFYEGEDIYKINKYLNLFF